MSDEAKKQAAAAALEHVRDGMALGLGTGSTAAWFVRLLGERVTAGLKVRGVATSAATESLAHEVGVPITTLDEVPDLDLAIDGADEVDAHMDLIKGGGGALLREKIVASCAKQLLVIVDGSKRVRRLGAFPLPVEVIAMAATPIRRRLADHGREVRVRLGADGQPFRTDEGNLILDCEFGTIADAALLARTLDAIPGVVEHGLFVAMTDMVIVAGDHGLTTMGSLD
ncbi:MAG: ribose-5-phosphate isomerase RpiA [Alphaproteobacteria bacterium]